MFEADEPPCRCGTQFDRPIARQPPAAARAPGQPTGRSPATRAGGQHLPTLFAPGPATNRVQYVGESNSSWDYERNFGLSLYTSSTMSQTVDVSAASRASASQKNRLAERLMELVPSPSAEFRLTSVPVDAFRTTDGDYGAETAALLSGGAMARKLWPRGGSFWTGRGAASSWSDSPVEAFLRDLVGRMLITFSPFILPWGPVRVDTRPRGVKLDPWGIGTVGSIVAASLNTGGSKVAFTWAKSRIEPEREADPPNVPSFDRDRIADRNSSFERLVVDRIRTPGLWTTRGQTRDSARIMLSRQMVVHMARVCDELLAEAYRVGLAGAVSSDASLTAYSDKLRRLALAPALFVAKVWLHECIHQLWNTSHDACVEEIIAFRWAACVSSLLGIPQCDILQLPGPGGLAYIAIDSGFGEFIGTSSTCETDATDCYGAGSVVLTIGRYASDGPAGGATPKLTRTYLAMPGCRFLEDQ